MNNFTKQICPKCKSQKFKHISDDLIITCICGTIFKDNIEIEKKYISGKQAQLILNITTRQGLHKIVKEHNIEVKGQGAGKPNLYLESDVVEVSKKTIKQRKKTNPQTVKKAKKTKKNIEKNIETIKEQKQEADKKLKEFKAKEINPLNEIGQNEFLRVEQILKKNGTYEELDRAVLLAYCISYQKYIDAVVRSEEADNTTMDDIGNLRVHPYFTIADKCLTQMNKLANTLGIGSRNRLGLDITKQKKKSVFYMLNEKEEF